MPARAAWGGGGGRNSPRTQSPLHAPPRQHAGYGAMNTPPAGAHGDQGQYYGDSDPRFGGSSPQEFHTPPAEPTYEDTHGHRSGARSPAESERSTFTSISQRGVNPRWNPQPPMPQYPGPPRRPVQQRQDMILDNPDFQVPGGRTGGRPGGGARAGPGMVPGSAYPTGPL
jgi:hypothetical protein